MIKPSFKLEKELFNQGYNFVIGIDEAGRGPLAGPVVACAVLLKSTSPVSEIYFGAPFSRRREKGIVNKFRLIKDSKLLSEKQREELYDFICQYFHVGIGICDHKTIDRINILEATYLAMKKAVTDLFSGINNQDTRYKIQIKSKLQNSKSKQISNDKFKNLKRIVLVDGNKIIPNLSIEQRAVVNGDNLVKSISAASIVAKVTRDRLMYKFHKKYPQYKLDQHKGYGTKVHFEMIKKHGPCEIHRKSFRPFC